MKPALGYSHPLKIVCKLRNTLYGLKQPPCAWFSKFHYALIEVGFESNLFNHVLFHHKIDWGTIIILFMLMVCSSLVTTLKVFKNSNFFLDNGLR